MSATEEWLFFLQKHPEVYEISKSKLHMSVLMGISKQAKPIEWFRQSFRGVLPSDMNSLLHSLIVLKLAVKISVGNKPYYYATDLARELIARYSRTIPGFSI